jgi:hypothetical protein
MKNVPENVVLIQDSQDRIAVLESVELVHLVRERPTPSVEAGNGECKHLDLQRVVPYLEEGVDLPSSRYSFSRYNYIGGRHEK